MEDRSRQRSRPPACNRRGITAAIPPGPDPVSTADRAPPCPGAAGPGNGTARRRAATQRFSFGPFGSSRMIVTAFRARATHPELRSACSRTLRPSALTLDQTVRKKKIRDQPDSRRHDDERHRNHDHQADRRGVRTREATARLAGNRGRVVRGSRQEMDRDPRRRRRAGRRYGGRRHPRRGHEGIPRPAGRHARRRHLRGTCGLHRGQGHRLPQTPDDEEQRPVDGGHARRTGNVA